MISIPPEQLEAFVRERIASALTDSRLRALARGILRRRLEHLTLREAARWLKWKSPESLRRALARDGVDKIKGCPDLTYTVPDLIAFRERRRCKGWRSKQAQSGKVIDLPHSRSRAA